MWSVVEKTALAEAEVEYHEHTSHHDPCAFPVVTPAAANSKARIVIWTTTPWTIPGNRAIAYGQRIRLRGVEVDRGRRGSTGQGRREAVLLPRLASRRQGRPLTALRLDAIHRSRDFGGRLRPSAARPGLRLRCAVLAAEFVTDEPGTGFVHIAPGHGADDFVLGRNTGLEIPQTVVDDGSYSRHVPLLAGMAC